MLKMDQVHVLRHKVLKEGQSIRRVARELGLSRNTVAKYLDQPEPVKKSAATAEATDMGSGAAAAGGADRGMGPRTTAKQRITAMRLVVSSGRKAIKSEGRW